MRVLVTGAAGFIGQHTVKRLADSGEVSEVVALDVEAFPEPEVAGVPVDSQLGDIRDPAACLRAASGVQSIIHLAAVASVPASIKDPLTTHETNATGTLNVLEAARSQRVPHVIVASSSAVYGEQPTEKKHEQLAPEFLSPYAASKGATEAYAFAYAQSYGMSVLAFRFFNVFGPGQAAGHPYAAVIPRFLEALKEKRPLQVFGNGQQTRDFVSVHTVADVLTKSSLRGLSSTSPVNVAAGVSMAVNELIAELASIEGNALDVSFENERPGDIKHSGASVQSLKDLLPDAHAPAFRDALEEVYAWYLQQKE